MKERGVILPAARNHVPLQPLLYLFCALLCMLLRYYLADFICFPPL